MSFDDDRHSETKHGKSGGEQDASKAMKDNARAAIQYFMNNAPPGALREVMETCELLVDPSFVSSRFMEETLEQAAAEQRQIVSFLFNQVSYKAVLCKPGKLAKCVYLHPETKQRLAVAAAESELIVAQVSEAPPEAFAPEVEPYRAAVEKELKNYIQENYAGGAFRALRLAPLEIQHAVSVFSRRETKENEKEKEKETKKEIEKEIEKEKTENERNTLTAVLATWAKNAAGCWCCSWTSEWSISFSVSEREVALEGDVCVRTHINEDSSAQSTFRRRFPAAAAAAAATATAAGEAAAEAAAAAAGGEEKLGAGEGEGETLNPKPSASEAILLLPADAVLSAECFAKEIKKGIKEREDILAQEIQDFFSGRADRIGRSLRRSLPLYGEAFDWKQQNFHLEIQPEQS